jgi:hypothetical protein
VHKSLSSLLSLCNLGVLRVSVVNYFTGRTHHRDTENTEVAQRRQSKAASKD